MKHKIWMGLAALALAAACAAPKASKPTPAPAGALKLDPAASSLTAVALKNESKEVPVRFGKLEGWAALDGKGEVSIPLEALETGDVARDHNIKALFFELGKAAAFGTARFRLGSVAADLGALAEGKTLTAQALGSLEVHGGSLPMSGPLELIRQGKAVRATLGAGWAVAIDQTTLVKPLKELNAQCPQPHRVGNSVALKGSLVFLP